MNAQPSYWDRAGDLARDVYLGKATRTKAISLMLHNAPRTRMDHNAVLQSAIMGVFFNMADPGQYAKTIHS